MQCVKKGTADARLHLPVHAGMLYTLVDSAPGAMHGLMAFAYLRRQLHLGDVPDMHVHVWQCQRYAMVCSHILQHHLCIHCNTIYVHT